jgi:hypothetical protein
VGDIPRTFTEQPQNVVVNEQQKFGLDEDGYVYVRTNAKGEFTIKGLNKEAKADTITVTDTQVEVTANLSERNTISIRIIGSETVEFGGDGLVFGSSYPKYTGEEMMVDIQPGAKLYAICNTGKSSEIRVLEFA